MGAERPKGLGDVEEVRTWSHPDFTRVVVQLTHEADLEGDEVVRLAADPAARRPERLYLDIPRLWVGRKFLDGVPVGDGLLKGVRLGQNTLTTSRMVIDLERYGHHRMFTLQSPHRIVVDVYGSVDASAGPTHGSQGKPWKDGSTAPARRLSMGSRPLRTVVIDPGHGGKDPGAIGIGGVREKDVNLKLSRLLARRLRARGFEVVMTRKDDRYIDLEERTVIAESSRGDIFISIHANASRRRSLRGIEIYYLDEGHKRHNLEVAARENGVQPGQLDSLQRTLSRLRVSEASHHSRTLATFVHDDLVAGLAQTHRSVPDLGVKRGPFYVLFMSSMPAILIETGFLTNRQDAKLLRSEDYLDTLAAQIASGLGHYRNRGRQRTAEARSDSGLPQVGAR
jgi:N-acetylmuramoyl-L-alanine amidase